MASEQKAKPEGKLEAKKKRDRSPAYPFISLKVAVDRIAAFDQYFGRHAAPLDKAGLAWGFKEKSSQAFSTLAALKAYGLIEYGADRTAGLSPDGRNYIRAQQQSIKQEILRRCALKPKAINAYWAKWGADRPPNPICLDELVLKGGFNENAAPLFLRIYDETIAFAGLSGSSIPDISGAPEDEVDSLPTPPAVKVGDIVTWESGGVVQFEARRVTEIAEAEGGLFVEGNAECIPIQEVTVVEATTSTGNAEKATQSKPIARQASFNQDNYTLGNEGQVILQWPEKISQESYDELTDWIDLQLKKIARLNQLEPKRSKR